MIGTGFLVLPRENCVCAPGATLQRQIVTLQSSGTLPSGLCTEVAGTVCTLYYRLLYGMAQRILGHEPSTVHPVTACFKKMLRMYLGAKKDDSYFMYIICGRVPPLLLSHF